PKAAPEDKADTTPAPKADDKPKSEDKPKRKQSGRGGRRDDAPKGMGDHLPDFIAKSFDERRS
ncbi:MAG: DEAD/DEAH box helicase, partial [Maritimibacter harenae]